MQHFKPGIFIAFKQISLGLGSFLAACCLSLNLMAMDLQQAKEQGYLGEQPNGYLGTVQPNAESDKVKTDINAKRKQAYEQLAKQNSISIEQVAKLAGNKAIQKTPPGQFVQDSNGSWIKK